MSTRAARAALLVRTARLLRPAQVAHRARLRAQRASLARVPASVVARALRAAAPPAPGWPAGFTAIDARLAQGFPDAGANAAGYFRFLAEERSLGDPADWEQAGAPRLWRFHLHGFEWAWAFLGSDEMAEGSAALARLWRSWQAAAPIGRGDAWSPYVASLRAWALCGLFRPLLASSDAADDVVSSLREHAGWIRAHLELDVGGNHLVKNLKAMAGLGVFLDDDRTVGAAADRLAAELRRQILADGGHAERSPSYHAQVLADLLDVEALLAAADRPPVTGLVPAVAAMRSWLGAMVLPDGGVALFNDAVPLPPGRLAALAPSRPASAGLAVLEPSGYVVMRAGPVHVVADVGLPCPPDLPAHAHADCLSFELAVDGRRVVVDTGTSTYEAGGRRQYERSTAAHSTVEVDGADQTEVWGVFRAARRARPLLERAFTVDGPPATVVVSASHDGYERLPGRPRHRRTWTVRPGGLEIADDVTGSGHHRLVARLVLAPGTPVELLGDGRFAAGPVEVRFDGGAATVTTVDVAQGFGTLAPAPCLAVVADGPLPARLVTTVTRRR